MRDHERGEPIPREDRPMGQIKVIISPSKGLALLKQGNRAETWVDFC